MKFGYNLFLVENYENNRDETMQFEEDKIKGNWNALSKPDRAVYETKAQEMGEAFIANMMKKIKDSEHQQKERENLKKKLIEDKVNEFFHFKFDAEEWKDESFVIAHVNYYVKSTTGIYFPAEIAFTKFSVSGGIEKSEVVYLSCEKWPSGFDLEARLRIESTHKIPYPMVDAKSYIQAQQDIEEFFEGSAPPIIFAYNDDSGNNELPAVVQTIENIFEDSKHNIIVVNLDRLLLTIQQNVHPQISYSIELARKDLQKNLTDLVYVDIGCKYHRVKEPSEFCSLAMTKRLACAIFQTALPKKALMQGKHVPKIGNIEISPNSSDHMSFVEIDDDHDDDDKDDGYEDFEIEDDEEKQDEIDNDKKEEQDEIENDMEEEQNEKEEFEEFDMNDLPF